MKIFISAWSMIGADSPVTVLDFFVSDEVARSLALTSPRRIIYTSAPVSIVIAAEVLLIFPGIVRLLPLMKLPIFTSLEAFFIPASTSPKIVAVFSFPTYSVEEISVVCFSSKLVIERDNRV
ncbi:hypothetical protein Zmor_001172 [Zophobas morio]|uniref:Uncharacterized protein n=1 Tax=Zophobas morio TaxID=2755281 RepID=A0AA38J1Y8_9CUCU|nr:hypothetical protein Zmor_001172 [Zophobas morio]